MLPEAMVGHEIIGRRNMNVLGDDILYSVEEVIVYQKMAGLSLFSVIR